MAASTSARVAAPFVGVTDTAGAEGAREALGFDFLCLSGDTSSFTGAGPATATTGLRASRIAPSAKTQTNPAINGHFKTFRRPGACVILVPDGSPPLGWATRPC